VTRRAAALSALLCLGMACRPSRGMHPETGPTVWVVNSGQNALRIFVLYGNAARFLGTVQPGEKLCFVLPYVNQTYNLGARSLEGNAVSPAFLPSSAHGWLWELGMTLTQDEISLRPIDQPCK